MTRSAQFAALVAQQPDNELFRFSLAQALAAENRLSEALEHWRYCATWKTDWMMPRILLGKALLQLGHTVEARIVLESALALALAQNHEVPAVELKAMIELIPVADHP